MSEGEGDESFSFHLRGHDVFLFSSRYEAWGMPVLEAMASGLAIVTTDCLGVRSFATHGVNCLMADPTDLNTMAAYIIRVCDDPYLRKSLASKARETAQQFSLNHVAETLEAVLYSLTACSEELYRAKQASVSDLQVCPCGAVCVCAQKNSVFSRWHASVPQTLVLDHVAHHDSVEVDNLRLSIPYAYRTEHD